MVFLSMPMYVVMVCYAMLMNKAPMICKVHVDAKNAYAMRKTYDDEDLYNACL